LSPLSEFTSNFQFNVMIHAHTCLLLEASRKWRHCHAISYM